jgi:hypothetical protein
MTALSTEPAKPVEKRKRGRPRKTVAAKQAQPVAAPRMARKPSPKRPSARASREPQSHLLGAMSDTPAQGVELHGAPSLPPAEHPGATQQFPVKGPRFDDGQMYLSPADLDHLDRLNCRAMHLVAVGELIPMRMDQEKRRHVGQMQAFELDRQGNARAIAAAREELIAFEREIDRVYNVRFHELGSYEPTTGKVYLSDGSAAVSKH